MTSARLRRLLLPLLRAAAKGGPVTFRMRSAAQQGLFLLQKATPKSKGGRLRRIQKRTTGTEETRAIREEVTKRARNVWCEAIGFHANGGWLHGGEAEWDHWLHGAGRRRQFQSVETTWMLCRACHRARTDNHPSAEYWNAVFEKHCKQYGYGFTPHITHAQLKRSAP